MDDFRILIVDDEPYHRDLIKIRFEHEGLNVSCASNGMEGLRVLQEKRFDLIITDFHMPGMDSMKMVKHIRLLNIKTPIIMITGGDISFKRILHDKEAQVSMVLTKPINFRNLLNIVIAEKKKACPFLGLEAAKKFGEEVKEIVYLKLEEGGYKQ